MKSYLPTLLFPWNKLNIFSLYVSREILATPFKINLMLLPFHAHLSNHLSYNFFFCFFAVVFLEEKIFSFNFAYFIRKFDDVSWENVRNAMTIIKNVVVVFTHTNTQTHWYIHKKSHDGKHFLYNYFLVEQFTLDYRFVVEHWRYFIDCRKKLFFFVVSSLVSNTQVEWRRRIYRVYEQRFTRLI